MRHLDLFSGIGGFALAAQWCWGKEYENVGHSEIEKFPCRVYHKHFPESRCLGDITKIEWGRIFEDTARGRIGRTGRVPRPTKGKRENTPSSDNPEQSNRDGLRPDLLTGGFPCQPFSVAGKRRGKEDDRWLWPEMLRAIRETRPRWVIGENVAGIIRVELDQVLSDLENEGYQTEPFLIPACAVNAPHRRDRVWIVAHSNIDRTRERHHSHSVGPIAGKIQEGRDCTDSQDKSGNTDNGSIDAPDSEETELNGCWRTRTGRKGLADDNPESQHASDNPARNGLSNTNGSSARLRGINDRTQRGTINQQLPGYDDRKWEQSWYEVATRFCRVDDGVSNRVDRLKSLGNAIVPQVAYEIMKAIRQAELFVPPPIENPEPSVTLPLALTL